MAELKKHPSGRPIRKDGKKSLPIYRSPGVGAITPRLQMPQPKDAIGFHHFVIKDDEA